MGQAFAAARNLTALAMAALVTLLFGVFMTPVMHGWFGGIPECLCLNFEGPYGDPPPLHPPRVSLLRPHVRTINPPEILCVSPDDSDAVEPCEQLLRRPATLKVD